jgi:Tfp pilus assembly protein PilX
VLPGATVEQDRGVALILALLVLSFLTVIGSAFLTASTIDIWISDNYKSATQTLYVAEAGIDHGRELLRTSPYTPTDLLASSAGPDRVFSTSTDSVALLLSDDKPLIPPQKLPAGNYTVWLRNDASDGLETLTDTNEVLTLISLGRVGTSQKLIEAVVQKGRFPESILDQRLKTVSGLEALASSVIRNATDLYTAPGLRDAGGPSDYRVVAVNGNIELGPGSGYGVLLVGGEARVTGNFTWNGLLLVIGQGVMQLNDGVSLTVNGGRFVARTRATDGALLSAPAGPAFDITDLAQIKAANRIFPYTLVSIRER